jgi:Rrf2 family protein
MFSKTCEYAIRGLIFIAKKTAQNQKTGIKEIAAGIDASEPFIAKILHDLGKKGLVQSLKGPTGGFYLTKSSLNNSLADIVKAVDGDKLFSGCGLGLDYCSEQKPCPIHQEFKQVRNNLFDLLQSQKLGNLHEQLESKLVYLKQR